VFLSFTLSQLGMFTKWVKERGPGWGRRALINGVGLLMTALTVLIVAYSKLLEGAWITLVAIAALILVMKVTHRHYTSLTRQLALRPDEVEGETARIKVDHHTIVLADALTKASLKAINYARQLTGDKNITVFNVSIDEEHAQRLREKWEACGIPLPLAIKYSPYREILGPLVEYVESEEHDYQPGDMLTVVMPQFIVGRKWMNIYHNQTAFAIRRKLLHDRHIAVIIVPYVLER